MFANVRAVVVGLVALALCTNALAQKTRTVENGRTSVMLSADLVNALQALGVTPGTISPTRLHNGNVSFPATGGAIDLKTLRGQILHSGGLTFTAGSTEVRLQAFIIDTTRTSPALTGLLVVNGALVGRAVLFDIALSNAKIKLPEDDLKISDVVLTLNESAADTLNKVFGVTAFKSGLPIGTAVVRAELNNGPDRDDQ